MQQTIKNSQTPKFEQNKSQTTQVLYREPQPNELSTSRKKQLVANLFDLFIFIAFAILSWLAISLFLTAVFGG